MIARFGKWFMAMAVSAVPLILGQQLISKYSSLKLPELYTSNISMPNMSQSSTLSASPFPRQTASGRAVARQRPAKMAAAVKERLRDRISRTRQRLRK